MLIPIKTIPKGTPFLALMNGETLETGHITSTIDRMRIEQVFGMSTPNSLDGLLPKPASSYYYFSMRINDILAVSVCGWWLLIEKDIYDALP